jgi:hypothetical protein
LNLRSAQIGQASCRARSDLLLGLASDAASLLCHLAVLLSCAIGDASRLVLLSGAVFGRGMVAIKGLVSGLNRSRGLLETILPVVWLLLSHVFPHLNKSVLPRPQLYSVTPLHSADQPRYKYMLSTSHRLLFKTSDTLYRLSCFCPFLSTARPGLLLVRSLRL